MNVCAPSDYEFQILKPFYLFKQTNERGRLSLWGFSAPEITWIALFNITFNFVLLSLSLQFFSPLDYYAAKQLMVVSKQLMAFDLLSSLTRTGARNKALL